MWLITEEDLKHFEEIGSQMDKPAEEQMIVTKLFLPWTRRTWYLTEYNPEEQIARAYVKSGIDDNFDERWSVYIPELEELVIKVPLLYVAKWEWDELVVHKYPCKVERDEYFNWPRLFNSLWNELHD